MIHSNADVNLDDSMICSKEKISIIFFDWLSRSLLRHERPIPMLRSGILGLSNARYVILDPGE
jgi:hypothetical protein